MDNHAASRGNAFRQALLATVSRDHRLEILCGRAQRQGQPDRIINYVIEHTTGLLIVKESIYSETLSTKRETRRRRIFPESRQICQERVVSHTTRPDRFLCHVWDVGEEG